MYLRKKSDFLREYFGASVLTVNAFATTNFTQANLIADVAGVAAVTDPNLVGTWGMSESSSSPLWVSNTAVGPQRSIA